jgi:hypothetical protein
LPAPGEVREKSPLDGDRPGPLTGKEKSKYPSVFQQKKNSKELLKNMVPLKMGNSILNALANMLNRIDKEQ